MNNCSACHQEIFKGIENSSCIRCHGRDYIVNKPEKAAKALHLKINFAKQGCLVCHTRL